MAPAVVLAIDGGTESLRVGLVAVSDGRVLCTAAEAYETTTPANGWACQEPGDWLAALARAVQACIANSSVAPEDICAISFAVTTCTLVAAGNGCEPLAPAFLWSDVRSTAEADRIFKTGDPIIERYTNRGLSAEWMLPKVLWLKKHQPNTYERTCYFLEYGDWLLFQLTGVIALSANTATQRWLWCNDGDASSEAGAGWPLDLFERIGLGDLASRLPASIRQVGDSGGVLTAAAATVIGGGLSAGIPVFVGGGDAFIGLLGMGIAADGEFGLMTGSSNVLSGFTSAANVHGAGLFGCFPNAVLPGLGLLEAGQTATGSMLRWFQQEFCGGTVELSALDAEAESVPVGAGGVICLDGFQGNRTPHVDSRCRGALWGMSLGTSRAHIFRAMLEGIAFGTRAMVDAITSQGCMITRLAVVGGATRSTVFMQILADVLGRSIIVPSATTDAAMLGAATVAVAGIEGGKLQLAPVAKRWAAQHAAGRVYEPDLRTNSAYEFYYKQYEMTFPRLREGMHAVTEEASSQEAAAAIPSSDAEAAAETGTSDGNVVVAPAATEEHSSAASRVATAAAPMHTQGPGVAYDTVAREWRCKWSADNDGASVGQVQQVWEAMATRVRAIPGVVRVQRMCCGTCMEYKIVISMRARSYPAWEARDHEPEAEFLQLIGAIDGVSAATAQLYSIMDA